jgi:hypothetical protein
MLLLRVEMPLKEAGFKGPYQLDSACLPESENLDYNSDLNERLKNAHDGSAKHPTWRRDMIADTDIRLSESLDHLFKRKFIQFTAVNSIKQLNHWFQDFHYLIGKSDFVYSLYYCPEKYVGIGKYQSVFAKSKAKRRAQFKNYNELKRYLQDKHPELC